MAAAWYDVDVDYYYIARGEMTAEEKEKLITVREAASQCGRNMETVRRWIWSGKLPARKLGNQLFIEQSALQSYCRETATRLYETRKAGKQEEFLERAARLRERIRARIGRDFTEEEVLGTIDQMREERMREIEQSLR